MAAAHRVDDLEISEDLVFQHRSWIVQRIGWMVMALTLIAAVLGLFGDGLFNRATARSSDGLIAADYPRFWRLMHPMAVQLNVDPRAVENGRLRLVVAGSYFEFMGVEQITPRPDRVQAAPDGILYEFLVTGRGQAIPIQLDLEPQKPGSISGSIAVYGGSPVRISHFVFP